MISHVLTKIYGSILENCISQYVESNGHRALEQAGFRRQHSTLDHIFTLRAVIEEARFHQRKVFCCFIDLRKAFDTVPRAKLFNRLRLLGVPEEIIWAVFALYEEVQGRVRAPGGWSETLHSTIGVKQGCPLSPTLFGLFIDEVVDYIVGKGGQGSSLAQSTISILLYADDLILISSSPEGLQKHLDALQEFCENQDLEVNLEKTKVMIFNTSRTAMGRYCFTYKGKKIEAVSSYVYLGITFSGPLFSMVPAARARLTKGYASLARMERQCFQAHLQDPGTKCLLFDSMVKPAAMYGGAFWGPDLSITEWARVERLQVMLCSRMIGCKQSVPHAIVQAEFAVTSMQMDAIFQAITYIQRVEKLPMNRLPFLALTSSRHLAEQGDKRSWFAKVTRWFGTWGLPLERLPPFQYSPESPFLTLSQQEKNSLIRADLSQLCTQKTWGVHLDLSTKLRAYRDLFLRINASGFIERPEYLRSHMSHALRVVLGQFRVSSHQLLIEKGRALGMPREQRLCPLCPFGIETEEHFVCVCPVYYEIRGRYHCLFEEGFGPLERIVKFPDQRCLALFLLEITKHRAKLLKENSIGALGSEQSATQQEITSFYPSTSTEYDQDRGAQRTAQRRTIPQLTNRNTRPRTLAPCSPPALLAQRFTARKGVTIGVARKLQRSKRSLASSRPKPSLRQLRIKEILQKHSSKLDPITEERTTILFNLMSITQPSD